MLTRASEVSDNRVSRLIPNETSTWDPIMTVNGDEDMRAITLDLDNPDSGSEDSDDASHLGAT